MTAKAIKPPMFYSIEAIQHDVCNLVEEGCINRLQPIYKLCQFYKDRDWVCVEFELERNDFLMRDRIVDLLAKEDFGED